MFTCWEIQCLLYTGVLLFHPQQPPALPFLFLCVQYVWSSIQHKVKSIFFFLYKNASMGQRMLQKSGKTRLTKCVKKLCVRPNRIIWLKNLVRNYVENMVNKFFGKLCWKIGRKSWVGRFGERTRWKCVEQ